jgi:hypothetical protein
MASANFRSQNPNEKKQILAKRTADILGHYGKNVVVSDFDKTLTKTHLAQPDGTDPDIKKFLLSNCSYPEYENSDQNGCPFVESMTKEDAQNFFADFKLFEMFLTELYNENIIFSIASKGNSRFIYHLLFIAFGGRENSSAALEKMKLISGGIHGGSIIERFSLPQDQQKQMLHPSIISLQNEDVTKQILFQNFISTNNGGNKLKFIKGIAPNPQDLKRFLYLDDGEKEYVDAVNAAGGSAFGEKYLIGQSGIGLTLQNMEKIGDRLIGHTKQAKIPGMVDEEIESAEKASAAPKLPPRRQRAAEADTQEQERIAQEKAEQNIIGQLEEAIRLEILSSDSSFLSKRRTHNFAKQQVNIDISFASTASDKFITTLSEYIAGNQDDFQVLKIILRSILKCIEQNPSSFNKAQKNFIAAQFAKSPHMEALRRSGLNGSLDFFAQSLNKTQRNFDLTDHRYTERELQDYLKIILTKACAVEGEGGVKYFTQNRDTKAFIFQNQTQGLQEIYFGTNSCIIAYENGQAQNLTGRLLSNKIHFIERFLKRRLPNFVNFKDLQLQVQDLTNILDDSNDDSVTKSSEGEFTRVLIAQNGLAAIDISDEGLFSIRMNADPATRKTKATLEELDIASKFLNDIANSKGLPTQSIKPVKSKEERRDANSPNAATSVQRRVSEGDQGQGRQGRSSRRTAPSTTTTSPRPVEAGIVFEAFSESSAHDAQSHSVV